MNARTQFGETSEVDCFAQALNNHGCLPNLAANIMLANHARTASSASSANSKASQSCVRSSRPTLGIRNPAETAGAGRGAGSASMACEGGGEEEG